MIDGNYYEIEELTFYQLNSDRSARCATLLLIALYV